MKRNLSNEPINSSHYKSIHEIPQKLKCHNSGVAELMVPQLTSDSTPELSHTSPLHLALSEQMEEYVGKLLECSETIDLAASFEGRGNVLMLGNCEFRKEIVYQMKLNESEMEKLEGIKADERMRAVLVDWMIDACETFNFCADTLFTSVSILDRFCSRREVRVMDLQLTGTTSMFVASKLHERYRPPINNFIAISNNLFTNEALLNMETLILRTLHYSLPLHHPLTFLDCYWEEIKEWVRSNKKEIKYLGEIVDTSLFFYNYIMYLLYLSLIEHAITKYEPSIVFASALLVVIKEIGLEWEFNGTLNYKEHELQDCYNLLKEANNREYGHGAHKKFGLEKYMRISITSGCPCIY
jgi:hypothetical protein